jgi:hypothetical protein
MDFKRRGPELFQVSVLPNQVKDLARCSRPSVGPRRIAATGLSSIAINSSSGFLCGSSSAAIQQVRLAARAMIVFMLAGVS